MTDTETVPQPFDGVDPQELLRTKPHRAGTDLFNEQPADVFVSLGQRPLGTTATFVSDGPHVSIAPNANAPSFTLDYDEQDAIKLIGALALAVGDLRKIREGRP
jgi:hypothetical protein